MPFDPAFQESEYQPQDNIGYDYQELTVQQMSFNPTLHESGSFGETLENNGLNNGEYIQQGFDFPNRVHTLRS